MAKPRTPRLPQLPPITAGSWHGEVLGVASLNFGQVVQPGPPRQSVEFTYAVVPVSLIWPGNRFVWPGVLMIMTPTPMKTDFPDAGCLLVSPPSPTLSLSFEVTRAQFSDMLPWFETGRFKGFHFTLEDKVDDRWPIHSWGMGTLSPVAVGAKP